LKHAEKKVVINGESGTDEIVISQEPCGKPQGIQSWLAKKLRGKVKLEKGRRIPQQEYFISILPHSQFLLKFHSLYHE
jgi:hypothetical protein